jgi:predicted MFS family arabinose efflux permease
LINNIPLQKLILMDATVKKEKAVFTRYEVLVIAILAITQFTVVLDFMVLSPLGAQLMKELEIGTSQFGYVVSAYAFSAGIAGLLTAGFADKFDRKKLLLFFYSGFIFGTFLCAIAPDYKFLLIARVVTGLFGGVISSVSFAIITDLFKMEVRGRVMGFVQMAFAVSQVMGIPVGLLLANNFGWHSPFFMIVGLALLIVIVIFMYLKPVNEHLKLKSDRNAFQHLLKTLSTPNYIRGFMATVLLATGGFMLMPFGSAFSIHNLGLTQEQLPTLYFITGIFSMIFGPLSGKLSDKIGKYNLFIVGSILTMLMVSIYTHLGITPLWQVISLNVVLFVGISSRMISASALMTAVPEPQDRGAFMGINSSIQQISGGVAAFAAGKIVVQVKDAPLQHYNILGYVVVCSMIITLGMMYIINKQVMNKKPFMPPAKPVEVVAEAE